MYVIGSLLLLCKVITMSIVLGNIKLNKLSFFLIDTGKVYQIDFCVVNVSWPMMAYFNDDVAKYILCANLISIPFRGKAMSTILTY